MIAFLRRQIKAFRREDGTATTEFAIIIPLLLGVFMASFESGLVMVRSTLLEQSVDMTMRNLRLGQYPIVDSNLLKDEICARTIIFPNCQQNIMIEMQRISTANWTLPATPITCVDRAEVAQPVLTLQIGQQNDVMLVRVCIVQDLIFPTTALGHSLPQDGQGGVGLIAETAFVTEPT